jgi:hypothetical protein
MLSINLTNSKGRDAMVALRHVSSTLKVRWLDGKGRPATNMRILRAPLEFELQALLRRLSGPDPMSRLAEALIAGDPEVDLEHTGCFLSDTSTVYVDPDQKAVSAVKLWDILRNPDGSQRDRRLHQAQEQNVATTTPLPFSGKLMKKSEIWNRFVFVAKLQVCHSNGLTYDFLYQIARDLELQDSLLFVGAGPKGNQPLIFKRGGTPYRGFLEGRTRGDGYCLILHLANLELKRPEGDAAQQSAKAVRPEGKPAL